MIVWGGYNYQDNIYPDTGGRYNPKTDSWIPTSMANALPRISSTGVWTGDRMVIWGGLWQYTDSLGHTHNYSLSTGGQYCAEAPPGGLLKNISARTNVQTGDNVTIGGFIVSDASDASKTFLIRAIGPSLSQYGVTSALQDPILELDDGGGATISTNNDWADSQRAQILSTGLAPTNDREAAIYATLTPGSYTAVMRGNNNTTGIGLIEIYDITTGDQLNLLNLSTRAVVGSDDNVVIGGVIVTPPAGSATAALTILARGIGPSLAGLGVSNPLQDPVLELYDANGASIRSNDNWQSAQQADIELTSLAPSDPRESAILVSLAPGSYTAILRGSSGTTGVGLVEFYSLP
jgi:hypothetical protein